MKETKNRKIAELRLGLVFAATIIGGFGTVPKTLEARLEVLEIREMAENVMIENDICKDTIVIFWPSTQPKNAIPRWYAGRKWHIPMASNRKRSRGRIKAYDMGQGEGPIVPLQLCTGRE